MTDLAIEGGGYALPTYPFVPPPELATGRGRARVVVVGGGLSGLTLACDLAVRGIDCVLLDEDDTIGVRGASSRGIVYARKTLEIFRRLGTWPRIRDKAVIWNVGRTLVDDAVVYGFDMSSATASEQPAFVNIQQFYIEWFLVDRILELGRTDLRWKNRVVGATQQADHVSLEIETPAGSYTLDAEWVVDASGLASRIRNGFNLDTHSAKSTDDRWCITDVRFDKTLPMERWTWVEAPSNEGRAVWQHPMADGVWRLDFQMEPSADPAYVSRPDVAAERLRRHLGADVAFELVWVGPYQYRAHLLDTFRHGRVLFVGDAAHVVSPFGARGGNSGIQDADNLGWKLALVLRGEADEALLDSYSEERRAAALVNLEVTQRTARFLAPRSPAERRLRSAVLDLARRFPFAEKLVNTGRLSVEHAYADSPIVAEGGGQALPNMAVGLPGGGRGRLLDLMPAGSTAFLALAFGDVAPAADVAPGRPVRWLPVGTGDGTVGDPEGALQAATGARPGEVALIRPDLHLAGRAPLRDHAAVEALLARALGGADRKAGAGAPIPA